MTSQTEKRLPQKKAVSKSGFTLVELLLVMVVIGIAVGITMPYFVHSIRGNRLRVAGRTMLTVTRYARSMAVLKQAGIDLTFDLDTGKIDLVSSNAALPKFTRNLEGVQLESVQVGENEPVTAGKCVVPFYKTGFCRPFEAQLADQHGAGLTMKVDALAEVRLLTD